MNEKTLLDSLTRNHFKHCKDYTGKETFEKDYKEWQYNFVCEELEKLANLAVRAHKKEMEEVVDVITEFKQDNPKLDGLITLREKIESRFGGKEK